MHREHELVGLGVDDELADEEVHRAVANLPAADLEQEQLVDDNQDLIETFRADLAAQLADALNFSALDIEDSSLVFTNEGIELTPDEMRTYLNFPVYADE